MSETEGEMETVSKEEVLKRAAERERIAKEMAMDDTRTKRQREVEACFSGSLPTILETVIEDSGSKTAALDHINEALKSNGFDGSMSRPTLYAWLKEHDLM